MCFFWGPATRPLCQFLPLLMFLVGPTMSSLRLWNVFHNLSSPEMPPKLNGERPEPGKRD